MRSWWDRSVLLKDIVLSWHENAWELDGSHSKHSRHDNKGHIYGVAVSSKFLLAVASTQAIQIWDLTTGEKLAGCPCLRRILPGQDACLAFSPDGEMFATRTVESASSKVGASLRPINLLVARTGKVIRALHVEDYIDAENYMEFEAIAFSSDNNVIACSSRELIGRQRKIALYATATGQIIKTIPGVWNWSVTFSFVQSDQQLLIGSAGSNPRLWDITTCTFDDSLRIYKTSRISSHVVTGTGMVIAVHRLGQLVMYDQSDVLGFFL